MNMLWSPNPRRRKGKRKMSAKQAKYFGGKKRRRSGSRSMRRQAGFATVPSISVHKRRRVRRSMRVAAKRARRGARRLFGAFSRSGALNLLKAGAIGGAGAVAVDVAMGQVVGFLPPSMQQARTPTGDANLGYFGIKAAIALGLGMYGSRLPVVGKYAGNMAEGALTVMAYQFMRPMVPANLSLGAYFNPGATRRPALNAYQSPRPAQIPVRAGVSAGGRGGRAALALSMVRNSRGAA